MRRLLTIPLALLLCAGYPYDGSSLPYPKTDKVPLPGGEDPTKNLQASDWNSYGAALDGLRSAIEGAARAGGSTPGILQGAAGWVNVMDKSCVGNGSTDDTACIAAALTAATGTAGGVVFLPPDKTFKITSILSVPAGVSLVGSGISSVIRKGFNGDMVSMGAQSVLSDLNLDGVGGTYTGRGVIITTGDNDAISWRKIRNVRIQDTATAAIEFTAAKAGFGSTIVDSILSVHSDTTYAIKMAPTETNGNRHVINVSALSGPLIDLNGSQNTLVFGCQSGSAVANDSIKFTANTIKARVIGNRFAGGLDTTVLGTDNTMSENILAQNITLGSGAAQCDVRGNNYSCAVTDSSGNVNNLVDGIDFTPFTPTWTTAGTAPSLGNGTVAGNYSRNGRTITIWVEFTPGTTTTFGTGAWTFALPFTNNAGRIVTGSAYYYDLSATTYYQGFVVINPAGTVVLPGLAGNPGNVTNAVPFTWATGDKLVMQFAYTL